EPQSPMLAKLARGLLALRRGGRWETTQENAWALVALDDARASFAAPSAANSALELRFNGERVSRSEGAAVGKGTIPMSKLLTAPGGLLSFRSDGGPLFYEAALRYARQMPPSSPLEHGIVVERRLVSKRRGVALPARDLHVGDEVEVHLLLVSAAPRDLVVLDDPIPAGFEATSDQFLRSEPEPRSPGALTHREWHDDRVVSYFDRLPAGMTQASYRL